MRTIRLAGYTLVKRSLKVRRIGHNAMLEQDAVHIGCEADLAAHGSGRAKADNFQ